MHQLLIAPTAFRAAERLQAREKALFFDCLTRLSQNTAHPGLGLHPLEGRPNVKSVRVSRDLRAILHQDGPQIAVVHVDHHDAAYAWADRRTIDRHAVTGAVQVVESIELIRQVEHTVERPPPRFTDRADDYLLSLGVPETWLPALREIRTDDDLLAFCSKAPDAVGERLLRLSAGELVVPPEPAGPETVVAERPDLRQQLYVVERVDELSRALDAPLEQWITFLHPSQRFLVDGTFRGPVKVSGSAGTGKTVVLLHRARALARKGHKVLLTSYVALLCRNLEDQLRKLCSTDELTLITVSTLHKQALRLARLDSPRLDAVDHQQVEKLIERLVPRYAPSFSTRFALAEWQGVVQAQGLEDWPAYRTARRTGRGRALAVQDRKTLWELFEAVRQRLAEERRADWPDLCRLATQRLGKHPDECFDAVLVDEVQDLKTTSLRFAHSLCRSPASFMIAGDTGQRIFEGGFSLSALGIEIRGRSHVLRVNYRTTEQIRQAADRLLGAESDDLDGGVERRDQTRSLFRGPSPILRGLGHEAEEHAFAAETLREWCDAGRSPSEIAVFARTHSMLKKLGTVLTQAGLPWHPLKGHKDPPLDAAIRLVTLHGAKGLEFKAVLVVGARSDQLPNRYTLGRIEDPLDREQAIERERRLLYVGMTRARDELVVTWHGEPSPFLKPHLDLGEDVAP